MFIYLEKFVWFVLTLALELPVEFAVVVVCFLRFLLP